MTVGDAVARLSFQTLAEVLTLVFLGAACISEWRTRRFTNWLTLPALIAVAGWRLFNGEWQFLLVWTIFFYCWLRGWYGGGDAKVLMVTTGVWTGWSYLLWLSGGLAFIYGVWAFMQKRGRFGTWLQTVPLYAMLDAGEGSLLERDKVFVIPLTAVTAVYYVAR